MDKRLKFPYTFLPDRSRQWMLLQTCVFGFSTSAGQSADDPVHFSSHVTRSLTVSTRLGILVERYLQGKLENGQCTFLPHRKVLDCIDKFECLA